MNALSKYLVKKGKKPIKKAAPSKEKQPDSRRINSLDDEAAMIQGMLKKDRPYLD